MGTQSHRPPETARAPGTAPTPTVQPSTPATSVTETPTVAGATPTTDGAGASTPASSGVSGAAAGSPTTPRNYATMSEADRSAELNRRVTAWNAEHHSAPPEETMNAWMAEIWPTLTPRQQLERDLAAPDREEWLSILLTPGNRRELLLGEAQDLFVGALGRCEENLAAEVIDVYDLPLARSVSLLNAAHRFGARSWALTVQSATGAECVALLGDAAALALVQALPGDPTRLLFPLLQDSAALSQALALPAFTDWVRRVSGEAALTALQQRTRAADEARAARGALTDRQWRAQLAELRAHPETANQNPTVEPLRTRLHEWFLQASSLTDKKDLFEIRFRIDLERTRDQRQDFTPASLARMWLVLDALPDADVAMTQMIFRTHAARAGVSGAAGGGFGAHHDRPGMTMSWTDDNSLGAVSHSAFADENDPMRGLNLFNATLRHEIGHQVGQQLHIDTAGGDMFQPPFGWGWHRAAPGYREVMNAFFAAFPTTMPSGTTQAGLIDALVSAMPLTPAALTAAVNAYGTANHKPHLYATVAVDGSALAKVAERMNVNGDPWNTPLAVGDRSYHVSYARADDGWVSAPTALWGHKPSKYAMRSAQEFFAECYAVFYSSLDTPGDVVGTSLEGRNRDATELIRRKVHGRVPPPVASPGTTPPTTAPAATTPTPSPPATS